MNVKVIIAGGGTGGHIFPAIAIANAIKQQHPAADILFVGAEGKMEMEKVPQSGYPIIGLPIAGFNRAHLWKNIQLPFKVMSSLYKAYQILRDRKPDVVVGVGGYASFPILRMAQWLNIPTVIQEQNSYAGKSNQLLGKKAKAICVAYEQMDQFFPKERLFLTGNPVRDVITNSTHSKTDGLNAFGLKGDKPVILAIGGSLGAKSINEAIASGLDQLLQHAALIWQTGKPFANEAASLLAGRDNCYTAAFIKDMEIAYAAADIVISRAGALAIAELCVVGKPVVFVPFPFAAEDHQTVNAMQLVDKQAGLLVKDSEAAQSLVATVLELINQPNLQSQLAANCKALGVLDADQQIAHHILQLVRK